MFELGILKIADGHSIHITQRGFVTAVGFDVLPVERFRVEAPEIVHGNGGQEKFQPQMAVENINFNTAACPQEPSLVADEMIETISSAPAMVCCQEQSSRHITHGASPRTNTRPYSGVASASYSTRGRNMGMIGRL